jgi:hypothetical protein
VIGISRPYGDLDLASGETGGGDDVAAMIAPDTADMAGITLSRLGEGLIRILIENGGSVWNVATMWRNAANRRKADYR